MRPVLIVGTAVGLASLVLVVGVGRGLSRRLRELERRTRLIARGDFSPMQLPRRDDEFRDLTVSVNEMAQQLAQLHETTRRSERLRLLGQVSGGLAHQLRNGLTGARLAVQLFLQESAQEIDSAPLEKALAQLTLMETHLQRFLHLGRQSDEPREPCVLLDLVQDTLDLVEPACRHAGIELRRSFSLAKNRQVSGVAGRLGQLFVNIISNAIEAAGPGGKVEVKLSEDATRNVAIIEVRDWGPGPPADIADRLFEPFVTGKPEGVGLGLAMAHQIAEEHRGTLGWARADGETCFWVELPLQKGIGSRE
jgi:signal transduction histidine kinase